MPNPPRDGNLEALLGYLHERRHFDFRGYKRASLSRRIVKRMQAVGVDDYERYMEVLEANPGEFNELFNTILINATSLMRDPDAWEALATSVIPAIVNAKASEEPIRVWSAGTASGEEAYSLAVLFADALGEDRFRRVVKIYATDADSEALSQARRGRYRYADLETAFGEERASRFFERDGDHGTFRGELRRALIFGRHDLVQDPPISRIDLVTCRNTLMYFTSEVQAQILASFHFALNPGGYLFLGKSEALVTRTQRFQVVDLRQHILRKDGDAPEVALIAAAFRPAKAVRSEIRLSSESAFEHSPVGQVVLDAGANVVLANRAARRLLSIGSAELGRPIRDADALLRPADLRATVDRVLRERRPVTIYDVPWQAGGSDDASILDVVAVPLDGQGRVAIALVDVTRYRHLREELERSRRELETAYEELQSTVEELETTNEELHSTNEELETMNEELQSTNEELETINNELRERSAEVIELNQFLQSILGSLKSAVVVLGTEMDIRAWNRQAEELWGLSSDEVVGQHFLNVDIGFPVEKLRAPIRSCLSNRSEREVIVQRAVNRRSRSIECTVSVNCLTGDGTTRGVILMMDAVLLDDQARQDGQPAQADGQAEKPAELASTAAADGRANPDETAG